MRFVRRFLNVVLVAAAFAPVLAIAQEDARGSKDHPLLTRYPASHIVEYEKNFNAIEFVVGAKAGVQEKKTVEGDATRSSISTNKSREAAERVAGDRNYQNAVKGIGGEVVYDRLRRTVTAADHDEGGDRRQGGLGARRARLQRSHAQLQAAGSRGRGDAAGGHGEQAAGRAEQERLHRALHQLRHGKWDLKADGKRPWPKS